MHNFNTVLNPLEQFEIKDFLSLNLNILNTKLSLTNFGLYLMISAFIIVGVNILITSYNKLISNS